VNGHSLRQQQYNNVYQDRGSNRVDCSEGIARWGGEAGQKAPSVATEASGCTTGGTTPQLLRVVVT
jgi:hypothetical protein